MNVETPLHPDHERLLMLARNALAARDNRILWRDDIDRAAAEHGGWCDDLWDELERQVAEKDGKIPALEHPSLTKLRRARQIRAEIVNACRDAISDVMDQIIDGGLLDDEVYDA